MEIHHLSLKKVKEKAKRAYELHQDEELRDKLVSED